MSLFSKSNKNRLPEKMTPDYKDYLSVKPLRKTDQVIFSFKKSEDGHFYIEIVVNGYYDTPDIIHLPNTTNPLRPIIEWLEQVITHGAEEVCKLEIGDATGCGKYYQLNYIPDTPGYGRFLLQYRKLCTLHIYQDEMGCKEDAENGSFQ